MPAETIQSQDSYLLHLLYLQPKSIFWVLALVLLLSKQYQMILPQVKIELSHLLSKKKKQELKKAQHHKFLYYAGKAPPEQYEDKPFNYKVLKGEAWNWVNIDDDIQNIELKIDYYDTVLRTIEEILKQVNQMSYNIKNVIEWRRFTGGM